MTNGWSVIGAAEGLPIEWARDVFEDREGSIWIASLGVHRMLGRGELTTYDRRSGLPNAVIWCFLWDRAGRLLVGTDLGLARSTATGWETVPGTAGHQIRSVVEETDGTLWMAGSPAEVLRVGATATFARIPSPDAPSSNSFATTTARSGPPRAAADFCAKQRMRIASRASPFRTAPRTKPSAG